MHIYICNLSFQAMDKDLIRLFSEFGPVKSARVVNDNFTGRSRGFGFVEMLDTVQATQAIAKLNNTSFMQKTIAVREATSSQKK